MFPEHGVLTFIARMAWCGCWVAALTLAWAEPAQSTSAPARQASEAKPFSNGRVSFEHGDVVGFVGGTDVAAAQYTGHLETLLAARHAGLGLRLRNFGWEGDTVFVQPRDVGFPPLPEHLERARVSIVFVQFGRGEALRGREGLEEFVAAYAKLLEACARRTPRLAVVAPPPFEKGAPLLPDLSRRNGDLATYVSALKALAHKRGLPFVDLFNELGGEAHRGPQLTDNGLQLTPRGQALVAQAFLRQLGSGDLADRAGQPDETGAWPNAAFERARQSVIAKNRLWFDYWRPQNWAFLGGDRVHVPSSRDHRDPKVRWFPAEMEKFVPLIEAKDREINEQASQLR